MFKAVSIKRLVYRIESTWLDSSHHGGKKQASTFGCPGYPSQTVPSCKRTFPDMTIPISNHIKIIKLATIRWQNVVSKNVKLICTVSFWHPHPPMVVPAASMASFQRFRASPDSSYSSRSICAQRPWRGTWHTCYLVRGPRVPVQTKQQVTWVVGKFRT